MVEMFNAEEAVKRLEKKIAQTEALRNRLDELTAEVKKASATGDAERVALLGKEAEQIVDKLIMIVARFTGPQSFFYFLFKNILLS